MRINSVKQVEQIYQKTSAKSNVASARKTSSDRIEISNIGRDLQVAKKAVSEAEDIRWDKVNAIKKRMKSGTYNVTCEEVAEKMADSYFSTTV
ncbi:flagellar biosynthesis anti-sigma factor FlgM [[Clostridium] polysaccharolyticum]|jgi:negative regulator of flagellin synthesis FlgM|uniref:Negative regulator of flagellin synthesis n=1 Tax=[Clostridium] polysaccharolyticum TaxID=29364 RepID=A0A1I0CTI4_9FIRM|nr:flagellar biosynthesis anti-sigma factor FlgM [[Clostridium] polysaccharolyticum]SET23122.1 anti-sigma-28 factor, FlgM family [[Clostridium] polysaccharolyticum]